MNQSSKLTSEVGLSLWDSLLEEDSHQLSQLMKNYNVVRQSESIQIQSEEFSKIDLNQILLSEVIEEKYVQLQLMNPKVSQFQLDVKELQQTTEKDEEQRRDLITTVAHFVKNSFIVQETHQQNRNKCTKAFEHVLKEKKIKGAFKKNTNVPKFLVRIFMKYFEEFIDEEHREELMEHYREVQQKFESKLTNNFTISDVLSIFRSETGSPERIRRVRRMSQRIMSEIIQNTLEDEVVGKKCLERNHISYMMAARIYKLRCRSRTLTERVKMF